MKKIALIALLVCAMLPYNCRAAKNAENEDEAFNKAEQALFNEDYDEALDFINQHLAHNQKHSDAYAIKAICLYHHHLMASALENAKLASKFWKKHNTYSLTDIYKFCAQIYALEGDDKNALKYFNAAIKHSDDKGAEYGYLAQYLYETQKYQEAEKYFQLAAENDLEEHIKWQLGIARCRISQGNYDAAATLLDEILVAAPLNPEAHLFRAITYLNQSKPNVRKYIDHYISFAQHADYGDVDEDGVRQAMEKDYEYGLKSVSAVINTSKKPEEKYFWLSIRSLMYEDSLQYDNAFKDLDMLSTLAQNTPDPAIAYHRFLCYSATGDYQQAREQLEILHDVNNTSAGKAFCLATMGECAIQEGKLQLAKQDFHLAMQTDKEYISAACFGRGKVSHMQGNMESALNDYEIALILDPQSIAKKYFYARTLIELGLEPNRAVYELLDVIAQDSIDEDMSYKMFALHFLHRDAEAIAVMNSMLNNGENHIRYYNAACLMALQQNYDSAIEYLRKAIDGGYKNFEYMNVDMDLKGLRETPQYQQLISEYINQLQNE